MNDSLYRFVASALVILLFSTLVAADDIEINLPISSATVHPYSAVITRSRVIQLPEGEHRLLIANLPANINPARLLLSIPNDNVRLGSLDIDQTSTGLLASNLEQRLQGELELLQDSRKIITDAIDTANVELTFVSSLASGGGQASVKPSVDSDEISSLLAIIRTSSDQARARIRDAEIALRELDLEIRAKEFELRRVATMRIISSTVTAQLVVDSNVEVTVSLSYPEINAAWHWLYEARLDTESNTLTLFRQAVITQNSGEDWINIDLTLTTADLREGATTPELGSSFVGIYEPVGGSIAGLAGSGNRIFDLLRAESVFEEIAVTAGRIRTRAADVIASQYLVDYKIPGKITIEANQQEKIVPIDNNDFEVNLVARSVPTVEPLAYLEARFTYTGEIPLQAASVQLYRDGAFIGDSRTSSFLPNQDISLAFGVDELIRIQTREEEEFSRSATALRRNNFDDFRVRFEVTSFHDAPVDIEIVSQVPVSTNARISVDIPEDATPADVVDLDGKAGLLMWNLSVEPQETQIIRHYFSISYPRDAQLEYGSDNF